MKKITDIPYSPIHNSCKLDLYLPETECFKTFVYFHGGGLEAGDKAGEAEEIMGTAFAQNGVAFLSVNYRMYPEAKYPDFIEDAAAAVRWAKEMIPNYGKSVELYVGGSSAGGYIAMMLCFDPSYGMSELGICGFVFDAGQPTVHFNVLRESGFDTRRIVVDERAPLYYIGGIVAYPKLLLFVAENDILCRYEQTQLFCAAFAHFGMKEKIELHVMQGYGHCGYTGNAEFQKIVLQFMDV